MNLIRPTATLSQVTLGDAPPLFKFMDPVHADGLLQHGRLRLGTFADYRREEDHGAEIGDAGEGTATQHLYVKGKQVWTPETMPKFAQQFIKIEGDASIELENSGLAFEHHYPPSWLYCVSTEFSEQMLERSGYTACVQVMFPYGFFKKIDQAIRDRATWVGLGLCVYEGRTFSHESGRLPIPLLKDPRYAYQKEARAIWASHARDIEPILLAIPGLGALCRRIR